MRVLKKLSEPDYIFILTAVLILTVKAPAFASALRDIAAAENRAYEKIRNLPNANDPDVIRKIYSQERAPAMEALDKERLETLNKLRKSRPSKNRSFVKDKNPSSSDQKNREPASSSSDYSTPSFSGSPAKRSGKTGDIGEAGGASTVKFTND